MIYITIFKRATIYPNSRCNIEYGLMLAQRSDAIASLSTNWSTAFKWKLHSLAETRTARHWAFGIEDTAYRLLQDTPGMIFSAIMKYVWYICYIWVLYKSYIFDKNLRCSFFQLQVTFHNRPLPNGYLTGANCTLRCHNVSITSHIYQFLKEKRKTFPNKDPFTPNLTFIICHTPKILSWFRWLELLCHSFK